jgi:formate hydrogenlyase subunit 4
VETSGWLHVALGLALAPLLPSLIARVKAVFAGRNGPPLLQAYWDLAKLLRKGAVYSRTTSWVFRAGPVASVAGVLAALAVLPFGGAPAVLAFPGDILFFVGALGFVRFVVIVAALDTGSAFEGMGASREAQFSALIEPALLAALAAAARERGAFSLSTIFLSAESVSPALVLIAAVLLIVYLCENSRIPFDDPNTHLELTMIHEVMVLDHGGPDFGLIQYAAALKLWILGVLWTGIFLPFWPETPWAMTLAALALTLGSAVVTGIVESVMARLRLTRTPSLSAAALGLAILAFILIEGHRT